MSRQTRAQRRAARLTDLAGELRSQRRWLTAATIGLVVETAVLLAVLAGRIG